MCCYIYIIKEEEQGGLCRLIGIHVLADGIVHCIVGDLSTIVCSSITRGPADIFMETIPINNFI
jgi:hypothetical protein